MGRQARGPREPQLLRWVLLTPETCLSALRALGHPGHL